MGRCSREKADPTESAGLCPKHEQQVSGESSEETTENGNNSSSTPTPETAETGSQDADAWENAEFGNPDRDVWPPAHADVSSWMLRKGGKNPWAPWADPNAPVACTRGEHDTETTTAECDHSARFKWGSDGSDEHVHADVDTALQWREKHPQASDDLVFIQSESDPFGFVDGDDVRCPETGDVHPAFIQILNKLGLTYADVSQSESGDHAMYVGELPGDQGQAVFQIDDEPWGENDDPPTVEIYTNKHVCIATGKHVPGTPVEVREWDESGVEEVLDEYDARKEPTDIAHDTDDERDDLTDYEPNATASNETSEDVRDVLKAVDQLDPSDVRIRTSKVGTDASGWEKWDPSTYRTSSGNDSLHRPPREPVFHDHKHGESFGVLSLLAAEEGIIPKPWSRLSGRDWWEAVDLARERGAPIPEHVGSTDDAEPVAAIPLARLDKLDDDEARRVARQHGLEWPDTTEARRRLRDRLMTAMRNGERTVLDAPTALGKSFTTATEPWLTRASATGQQPVVHFHETREARDQAADHSKGAGVDYRVLLGRSEACPVAAGEHDPKSDDGGNNQQVITMDGTPASQWFEAVCDGRGVPFSVAHRYLAEHNDQGADLPCCADDTQCLALSQWDGIPRDDDGNTTADVIHATHQFAMVPGLRNHVNAVFDERPDFAADLSTRRIQQAVTAFLKHIDAPVTSWETFVSLAQSEGSANGTVGRERDATHQAIDADPDPDWYMSDPNAHTIAPALTRAIWYALRDGKDTNGRFSTTVPHEPPRLDADANDDDGWNRVWLSVVLNNDHTVQTVRTAPDMSGARSVVGLDAHPTPELWQANLGEHMTLDRVLDTEERRLWRRLERGLTVVQVGDATRPFTSGEYFNRNATEEFVTAVRDRFGDDFQTVVTAGSVEQEHKEILQQAGVSDPETMHFGEEKSRGDFGGERVGLVNGCIDPGDGYVLDLLAELGLDAEPEVTECGTCGGDGCPSDPDCRDGYRRAHGREFVGDDADSAGALLASVRENHVAQGAGRYARDASGDGGAVVFVRTNATPPGYVDLTVPGVQWVPTETQANIFNELANTQHATASELADAVDCSKEHVRTTLEQFHERGIIHVRENAGDHGAHLYRALAGVSGGVGVELEDDETTNNGVWCSYTWSLAVSAPVSPSTATRSTTDTKATAEVPRMQVGLTEYADGPPPE
jgi:hypothetical protein